MHQINKYINKYIFFRSVAAASMIQCLYMPPPNWHIIDDIVLNKSRDKAKEDFLSEKNKEITVENRSFKIWREFVEGRVSSIFNFSSLSSVPITVLECLITLHHGYHLHWFPSGTVYTAARVLSSRQITLKLFNPTHCLLFILT